MNPNRVRELNSLRPRLRDDLRLSFQKTGDRQGCVLEDPLLSRFHQLGPAELELILQFDGKKMFSEAYAFASIRSGSDALDEHHAVRFLGWLLDQRLVTLGGVLPEEGYQEETVQRARQKVLQGMNLISIRIPFGSPDRWLQQMKPLARLVCNRWMWGLWGGLLFLALATVYRESASLAEASRGVLAPHNWLALGLIWVGLKVWHEFAHALTCVYYGGRIRECGIVFILLMPLGYVDATASLAFASKWKRMHVAAAGVVAEVFLASLAILCWAHLDPGPLRYLLFNLALLGSVATLLFNLNPLMRFDGYYLLCDGLGIPNLGTRSSAWLSYIGKKYLLGIQVDTPPPKGRHGAWIYVLYGCAAWCWRILILVTLLTAAGLLFEGGGILFAASAVLAMIGGKVLAWRKMLQSGWSDQIRWPNTLVRLALVFGIAGVILFFPFRHSVVTAGVFQYSEEDIPRPEGSGWVSEVHVEDGKAVEGGDALVLLKNPEDFLRLQVYKIRKHIREIELRRSVFEGFVPQILVERAALETLDEQITELESQLQSLQLRASTHGRILARDLKAHQDMWVGVGSELLRVIDPKNLELRFAIPQEDLELYQAQIGGRVDLLLESGSQRGSGTFIGMDGRASRTPDLPELTAPAGGRIAVRKTQDGQEWIDPVFVGRISTLWTAARTIHSGERAYVRFTDLKRQSLWSRSRRGIRRIGDFLLDRAKARQS